HRRYNASSPSLSGTTTGEKKQAGHLEAQGIRNIYRARKIHFSFGRFGQKACALWTQGGMPRQEHDIKIVPTVSINYIAKSVQAAAFFPHQRRWLSGAGCQAAPFPGFKVQDRFSPNGRGGHEEHL